MSDEIKTIEERGLTRRAFVEIGGTAALGVALFGLAGCGPSRSEAQKEEAAGDGGEAGGEQGEQGGQEQAAEQQAAAPSADALVIYFSRTGENYKVGVIEEGNTAILAKMIAEKTGADTFEVVPAKEYPEGYDECCDVALEEQENGDRPQVVGDVDVAPYSTIYLGYPIWWGDLPMCLYTFLEAHDWSGKTIHPFCTHEGSGLGKSVSSIQSLCAGVTVGEGLSLNGYIAQQQRDEAEAAVDEWLGL